MSQPATVRIQPLRALKALGRLLRDPNDTSQVFEIIGALGARAIRRKARVLKAHPTGQRLLADRPSLRRALAQSTDTEFSPGTLGHAYHAFLRREAITTDGLIAVSDASTRALHDD
ncbi:MAG: Coq4 family protein, partial [Myxococcota bacterium]